MKKVLHLNAYAGGGAFMAAQRLSEALNQTGKIQSQHLVFTGNPGKNYTLWADSFIKRNYAFGLHALEKLNFLWFEKNKSIRFAFSQGLTGIDIANNPMVKAADIVHLHWINKGFISLHGLENLIKLGKPVVWTCHDMWPFTGGCYHNRGCEGFMHQCGNCPYLKNPKPNDLSSKVFEKKSKLYSLQNKIHFVAPSHWLSNIAAKSTLGKNFTVNVIPNGIDTSLFKPMDKKEAKNKFGLDPQKFTILFASANLSNPYKGYKQFNELLSLIKNKGLDVQILVIGENKNNISFEQGLDIHFAGLVGYADMKDCYNAADLYVSVSLEENLPTTLIESALCGTPVAAFNVGGTQEILASQEMIVPVGDTQELFKVLLDFMQLSEEKKIDISKKERQKALDNFDVVQMALNYLTYYNSL